LCRYSQVDGPVIRPFDEARNLYHLGVCCLSGAAPSPPEADVFLAEAAALCDGSVAQLKEEERVEAERRAKEEEENNMLTDGSGGKVKGVEEKEGEGGGEGGAAGEGGEEGGEAQSKDPRAFGSLAGVMLHAQVRSALALSSLTRQTSSLADPALEAAAEHAAAAVELGVAAFGLAGAGSLNLSGVIAAASGSTDAARKFHVRYLKAVEKDATYALQGKVEDALSGEPPNESLVGHLSVVGSGASFEGGSAQREAKAKAKLRAGRNKAISERMGVGMGFAMDGGKGLVPAATMRAVMDQHKKEFEVADKLGMAREGAVARGSLGASITVLGGRKSDAFDNLETNLKFAKDSGDKRMEAGLMRTMSELQESGGDWKSCAATLKRYLELGNELGDLMVRVDALKKLMGVYVQVGGTKREMDDEAVLGGDEYAGKTDSELDRLEMDDQFLRVSEGGVRGGGEGGERVGVPTLTLLCTRAGEQSKQGAQVRGNAEGSGELLDVGAGQGPGGGEAGGRQTPRGAGEAKSGTGHGEGRRRLWRCVRRAQEEEELWDRVWVSVYSVVLNMKSLVQTTTLAQF
jgi:hypothetical protein